jgi:hypothetical protein
MRAPYLNSSRTVNEPFRVAESVSFQQRDILGAKCAFQVDSIRSLGMIGAAYMSLLGLAKKHALSLTIADFCFSCLATTHKHVHRWLA